VELRHFTEYLSAKLRVYFLTSPNGRAVRGEARFVRTDGRLFTAASEGRILKGGEARLARESVVHSYPIKAPMLDIHTVGAGGGSIAFVDTGGLLKVGPRSAGADPGPACYDRGNDEPTVTDANMALQTLNPTHLLGGRMKVRRDLARAAIDRLAARLGMDALATAQGIIAVVTANMARAIRVISVQRGHDPRDYTLVAFGGAGPLHAARLAAELDIRRVLVPRRRTSGLCVSDYERSQPSASRDRFAPMCHRCCPAPPRCAPVGLPDHAPCQRSLPCPGRLPEFRSDCRR
jgi:N-methylhydantoinase A/oxoprolinase/acetone carboxylase beta subunit